jgi:hypothetical protein
MLKILLQKELKKKLRLWIMAKGNQAGMTKARRRFQP